MLPRLLRFETLLFLVNQVPYLVNKNAQRGCRRKTRAYLKSAKAGLSRDTKFSRKKMSFSENGNFFIFFFCMKKNHFSKGNQLEIVLVWLRTYSRRKIINPMFKTRVIQRFYKVCLYFLNILQYLMMVKVLKIVSLVLKWAHFSSN